MRPLRPGGYAEHHGPRNLRRVMRRKLRLPRLAPRQQAAALYAQHVRLPPARQLERQARTGVQLCNVDVGVLVDLDWGFPGRLLVGDEVRPAVAAAGAVAVEGAVLWRDACLTRLDPAQCTCVGWGISLAITRQAGSFQDHTAIVVWAECMSLPTRTCSHA